MSRAIVPADLTPEQARTLTDEIKVQADILVPLVGQAYRGRAWRALGYESWDAYRLVEFPAVRVPVAERPAAAGELRGAGMSQRQIGDVLGVSHPTAAKAIDAGRPDGKGFPSNGQLAMSGGRAYERRMPARQEVADTIVADIDQQHAEGDARRTAELEAVPAVAEARFRSNFATALRRAGEICTFDPDRVAESFAATFPNDVGGSLDQFREWCDQVEQAHRDRQRAGLRVIRGGTS
jgi:predicted transcriptional regulator